jgi:hypothetical protein
VRALAVFFSNFRQSADLLKENDATIDISAVGRWNLFGSWFVYAGTFTLEALMTAKQKLEALANRWYGYYMITALLSVVGAGFAVSRIIGSAIGLCFSLGFAYFLSSRLQAKSSLTRLVLVQLA